MLASFNDALQERNPQFAIEVRALVRNYVQQHIADREKFNQDMTALGLTLREKEHATKPINLEEKQEIKSLRVSLRATPDSEDVGLSTEDTEKIIRLIIMACRNFEVAPKVYAKLSEPDLRMIIVGVLNAVFESNLASGETFSKQGKADIVLNTPGGAVLIAECKKWGKPYGNGINQLSRYIRWRQSVGIIITFTITTGMTSVLRTAKDAIVAHVSYIESTLIEKASTHLISTHKYPTDPEKLIKVHHLFFDLTFT